MSLRHSVGVGSGGGGVMSGVIQGCTDAGVTSGRAALGVFRQPPACTATAARIRSRGHAA